MKLSWHRQRLRPKYRFATAQGGVDEKETIVVRLEHEGLAGLGEVVASRLYGQSLELSEAALERIARRLATPGAGAAADPFAIEPIVAEAIREHDAQRAVIAALDSACHDWVGLRLGVPVWKLLGLARPRTTTTFTIGVADPRETRQKVEEALAAGYEALKVKVGVETDQQTLGLIRERFGGPLLLDANEAWRSGDEAESHIRALARFAPAMIEQPLARPAWREFGRLRALGVAPIFVDESCQRPADVAPLAGLVDGINIKLNKCGGMREALRMIHLARGLGMGVMLGCFVSSSLAIAPALTLASLVDYADLDGALLLADDPFEGIVQERSTLSLAERPGLGVFERRAAQPA
ncbi:MAG: dipeptide epimerase [Phycisphaerae bacterium]|nr:dipeptide epimerase [Phycisphaerae bacterium]MCZ2398474.1 dipeptide epimerase [Phycisphaerae bacterium]